MWIWTRPTLPLATLLFATVVQGSPALSFQSRACPTASDASCDYHLQKCVAQVRFNPSMKAAQRTDDMFRRAFGQATVVLQQQPVLP